MERFAGTEGTARAGTWHPEQNHGQQAQRPPLGVRPGPGALQPSAVPHEAGDAVRAIRVLSFPRPFPLTFSHWGELSRGGGGLTPWVLWASGTLAPRPFLWPVGAQEPPQRL